MAIRTLTPLTDPNETFRIRNRPDRKAKVVKDSMLPYQIRTRAQVASILGLTDKRIQQIEQSALRKIRRALTKQYEDLKST